MKIKTDYIYNKVCSTALMMLCCVAFFSCTKVDVCRDRTHSHLGKISLVYEWSNIADSLRPDSMLVLVSQVVNSHRMGYVTDATDSEGGRYRFGKMSDDINVDSEVLMASAGDYSVYAFNNDVDAKGAMFRFDNLEAYGDGQHLGVVGIQDLTMSYVGYKLGEIDSYGKEWVSINPGFDYISTGVEPIYFATNNSKTSAKEHTFSVHEGSETRIHVYPRKITQDITISTPVYVECVDEDNFVSVDEVIAEVSGIPYKVKPYSGELNVDTICKLLFKMELDTVGVGEECTIGDELKTFLKYDCKSTISVTGLLANKNNEGCVGAGILQLCLYTRNIKDGDTIDMAPRYACINLYHTLDSANLVIEKEDSLDSRKSYFVRGTDKGTLDIKNGLMLTDEELMKYPQDGNASGDSWFVF